MARVQRALLAVATALALVLVYVGVSSALTSGPPPVKVTTAARVTLPTTTTTSVVPTTTTAPAPPPTMPRASRAATHPRPVVAPADPVSIEGIDCNAWHTRTYHKTRAQSDACWGPILAQYSGWNVNAMLTILWCESHGDAWTGKKYVGLLQLDNGPETRGNGAANIAKGHVKFEGQGYSAWPTCRHRAGV